MFSPFCYQISDSTCCNCFFFQSAQHCIVVYTQYPRNIPDCQPDTVDVFFRYLHLFFPFYFSSPAGMLLSLRKVSANFKSNSRSLSSASRGSTISTLSGSLYSAGMMVGSDISINSCASVSETISQPLAKIAIKNGSLPATLTRYTANLSRLIVVKSSPSKRPIFTARNFPKGLMYRIPDFQFPEEMSCQKHSPVTAIRFLY